MSDGLFRWPQLLRRLAAAPGATSSLGQLQSLLRDETYVLDLLGNHMKMYIGWHYYTGLAGNTIAHRARPQRPVITPILEKDNDRWILQSAHRKAVISREFQRERIVEGAAVGRVHFLTLFREDQKSARTAMEKDLNVVLCSDGEVAFFLLEWRLRKWLSQLTSSPSGQSIARATRRIAREIGLTEDQGAISQRLVRMMTWLTWTLADRRVGAIYRHNRDSQSDLVEGELRSLTLQPTYDCMQSVIGVLTQCHGRTVLQVERQARFNVHGHHCLRKYDSGSDKSVVYFPLVMPPAPEHPGLFFIATIDGLSRAPGETDGQHRIRVEAAVDRTIPWAAIIGLTMFGDIMAREEGALVGLLASHALRNPTARLKSITETVASRLDPKSTLTRPIREVAALASEIDQLTVTMFRIGAVVGRMKVTIGRADDSEAKCQATLHPAEFARGPFLILRDEIHAAVHRTIEDVACRYDLGEQVRACATNLLDLGIPIQWDVSHPLKFQYYAHPRPNECTCRQEADAKRALLHFLIPEMVSNAVKAAARAVTNVPLECRVGTDLRQFAFHIAGPGGNADLVKYESDRLLLKSPQQGDRRRLGIILSRETAWQFGWHLAPPVQLPDGRIDASVHIPTTRS